MAHLQRLKTNKESDRRAALLGLAASASPGKKTDCLRSEQIATLVEGTCSATEQQLFFEHLAICESCYKQWMELHAIEAAEQKRSKKIFRFQRVKVKSLAWAGSALAAAASVVLYLNIIRDTGQPLHKPQLLEERAIESTGALQGSAVHKERKESGDYVQQMEQEVPAPQSAEPQRKQTTPAARKKSSAVVGKQPMRPSVDQEVMLEAVSPKEEAAMFQMKTSPASVTSPLSLDQWFDLVRQACLRKEGDLKYWQEQYVVGSKLTFSGLAEEEQGRKFAEVLSLVEQLSRSGGEEDPCRKIEVILQ